MVDDPISGQPKLADNLSLKDTTPTNWSGLSDVSTVSLFGDYVAVASPYTNNNFGKISIFNKDQLVSEFNNSDKESIGVSLGEKLFIQFDSNIEANQSLLVGATHRRTTTGDLAYFIDIFRLGPD